MLEIRLLAGKWEAVSGALRVTVRNRINGQSQHVTISARDP